VIGKDVPFALLQAIVDLPDEALSRGLDHLQAAEFVYETGLYPDIEYTFKHALTHDVTYGGLLQERRRELHARIVGAIETLHRDRLGEQIERLAYHAFRGEMGENAVSYLRQAGGKAAARSAPQDARAWFEQALMILDALPESRSVLEQGFEIRLELRQVFSQLGELQRMLDRLHEADSLADRLSDEGRRGRVLMFLANALLRLGDAEANAFAYAETALEIAKRTRDVRMQIPATAYLSQVNFHRGNYENVVRATTENLSLIPRDWLFETFGMALPTSIGDHRHLIESLAHLGRFGEGILREAEAIRLAEITQQAYTIGIAYRASGILHLTKGDWVKSLSAFEKAIAAGRSGHADNLTYLVVAYSARALAHLGDTAEAEQRFQAGEQLAELQIAGGRGGAQIASAFIALGRAALLLARLDDAERLVNRALSFSAAFPGYAAYVYQLLGDTAMHRGRCDFERSEDYFRQSLVLAEPRGMRPLIAHCHFGLGKLYRRSGKCEQAREHVTIAATMYREMDMRFWLEQAEAEMRALA
jgi:tetratricopeptide (TPR) repeat protein